MTSLLARLARVVVTRPGLVLTVGVVVVLALGALAAGRLRLETARLELVGPDAAFTRDYLALEAEFGDLDALVVTARGPDRAATLRWARALDAAVRADPAHFGGAFYRVDADALGARALLLAPAEALARLDATLGRALPALEEAGPLAGALLAFARELEALGAGQATPEASGAEALGALAARLVDDVAAALEGRPVAGTPLDAWDALGAAWASDEETLVVLVAPQAATGELDPRSASVGALRRAVAALAPAHPGVEVGLTGKPVLEVDEMRTYERDSARSSALALCLVTALVVLALRRLVAPLLIGAGLLLAIVATLGLAAVWPGHLNLMAVVFVVIVIGLGVDFALHVVARFDEEVAAGLDVAAALERALVHTGGGVVAGAVTTAAAFLVALLTDFKGLREFGAIAAMGVLACLVLMGTALPAAVVLLDRRRARPSQGARGPRRVTRILGLLRVVEAATRRRPRVTLVAVALVTCAAAVSARQVRYEPNLLRLQDPTLPSVQLELRLMADQRLSSWFLAWPTHDLEGLARVSSAVLARPTVERVESVLTILPSPAETARRLPRARAVQARALAAAPREASDRTSLHEALAALEEALEGATEQALAGGRAEVVGALERLLERASRARARLASGEADAPLPAAVVAYDRALGLALAGHLERLRAPAVAPLSPADLPPDLRARLVGRTGAYLLRIYPREDVWDHARLRAFLADVRQVLPDVTGVPVLVAESSQLMLDAYREAAGYAVVAVCAGLLLLLRSVRGAALALAALGTGTLWLVGAMGALGLELDPANLVALPLLLGIGVDTAIHIVQRAREGGPDDPVLDTSLGRALVYSALTSVAGFGSLAVAGHQGMASIGLTISLGVLTCLASGVLVPLSLLGLARRT